MNPPKDTNDHAVPSAPSRRTAAGLVGVPGQGAYMLIVLKLEDARITEAKFSTYGCAAAVSCGQFVAEYVEGRDWRDVVREEIDEGRVVAGTGPMPLGREHCPTLAVQALRNALDKIKEP